ncbi:MAG: tetraacyldisaccharide 4'-kinase [Congregibacter sp.]
MRSRLTPMVERAWYSAPGLLWLLLPLEALFYLLVKVRRGLFQRGWMHSTHPGVPVLVVGNINAGGTGKTPAVIAIVTALIAAGFRVGVVSRGYGGSVQTATRLRPDSLAFEVGDEPLLIYQATGAEVVVGTDRVSAAIMAVEAGAQLIVCDDGLQHYRLARDVEIVTIDAKVGFGNGHLLPLGPLREPQSRLADVDFSLLRDGDDPRSATSYTPDMLRLHGGQETRVAQEHGFAGPVHALAAIARPERFFETLRGLGIEVIEHRFPDHHNFSASDFSGLDEHPVVVTAKDAVKLPKLSHPVWVLDMQLELPDTFVTQLISRVRTLSEDYA